MHAELRRWVCKYLTSVGWPAAEFPCWQRTLMERVRWSVECAHTRIMWAL